MTPLDQFNVMICCHLHFQILLKKTQQLDFILVAFCRYWLRKFR